MTKLTKRIIFVLSVVAYCFYALVLFSASFDAGLILALIAGLLGSLILTAITGFIFLLLIIALAWVATIWAVALSWAEFISKEKALEIERKMQPIRDFLIDL